MSKKIVVTGGLGFIGANFVERYAKTHPNDKIVILDAMTYAHSPHAVKDVLQNKNVGFHVLDIAREHELHQKIKDIQPDDVYHFAAETHVCNSIQTPLKFWRTNLTGTLNLLDACREIWKQPWLHKFVYIGTDEIFGELPREFKDIKFKPTMRLDPRSPYSASKAAGMHAAFAYQQTYGLRVIATACSNNFGKYQHKEKLIPKTLMHLKRQEPIQIYGDGLNIRDWISVEDHVDAIMHLAGLVDGQRKIPYLIGGEKELTNIEVMRKVYEKAKQIDHALEWRVEHNHKARPTDDSRYAIDTTELRHLGFIPRSYLFDEKLEKTIKWYLQNEKFD